MSLASPGPTAIKLTSLDFAFQEFLNKIAMRWKKYHGRLCKSTLLNEVVKNRTYLALTGLEYQMLATDTVLTEMRYGAATDLSGTKAGLSMMKRFVKPLLGEISAAIVFAPNFKARFCHYFAFPGLCGRGDLDKNGKETVFLDERCEKSPLSIGSVLTCWKTP